MNNESTLKIAFPSKGRLRKDLEELLASKKINFIDQGNDRNYIAKLSNHEGILIYFMGAKEIVTQLAEGNIHLGVTGDDLIQEYMFDYETKVSNELVLNFGKADLVVAVPKIWLDVSTMADLDEISHIKRIQTSKRLKVATKYTNLTNRFFSKCGVTDYRTVNSSSSTESAPFNGMSDIIVDITSTGETLKANNLRILDDGLILNSSANIFKSQTANWNSNLEKISEQFLASVS
jgi:ATP phosphoribosyltransferase